MKKNLTLDNDLTSCNPCSYYHGSSSPCGNCGWDCAMSGMPYYCCCSSSCCCYSSYGSCSSNQHCPASNCGSQISTSMTATASLSLLNGNEKTQCQPIGGKCVTTSDCCINLCSPTSCSGGVCIGSYCKGRGSSCQMDCECCSKDCVNNEITWGICN